jgi:hypothetical protein
MGVRYDMLTSRFRDKYKVIVPDEIIAGKRNAKGAPLYRDDRVVEWPVEQDTLTRRYTEEAIVAEFEIDPAAVDAGVKFGFSYRGQLAVYDAKKPRMEDVDVEPLGGRLSLRVVVDRVIHEAFYNNGLLYRRGFHDYRDPAPDRTLQLFVQNAPVRLHKLEVQELGKAGWKPYTSCQLIQHPVNR